MPSVFRGVKFSCHFTLTEVQERWNALMYEPIISKMAVQVIFFEHTPWTDTLLIVVFYQAIKNLHPEVVLSTQRKTLFSKQEQETVSTIKASTVMDIKEATYI